MEQCCTVILLRAISVDSTKTNKMMETGRSDMETLLETLQVVINIRLVQKKNSTEILSKRPVSITRGQSLINFILIKRNVFPMFNIFQFSMCYQFSRFNCVK